MRDYPQGSWGRHQPSGSAMRGLSAAVVRQFARYTAVGAAAFVLDLLVLTIAIELFDLHYLVAGVLGFAAGVVLNYVLSVRWVFERRAVRDRRAEFTIFALIGVTGLALNEGVLYALAGKLSQHYVVAKMASGLAVLVWTFAIRRLVLFRS